MDEILNVALVLSNWLADSLLVWRCAILTFYVLGTFFLVQISSPSSSPYFNSSTSVNWTLPYFFISLAINIIVTIKERNREASQNVKPGTIKRMQFAFFLDHPSPVIASVAVSKPNLKPLLRETLDQQHPYRDGDSCCIPEVQELGLVQRATISRVPTPLLQLLRPIRSAIHSVPPGRTSQIPLPAVRPTIELPLGELLSNIDATEDYHFTLQQCQSNYKVLVDLDVVMQETSQSSMLHTDPQTPCNNYHADLTTSLLSQFIKDALPQTTALNKVGPSTGMQGNTPNGRLNLTVKTHNAPTTRSSGPSASGTSIDPAVLRRTSNNSAPGGVNLKAECSNCGATHTPLWRRGLNDEL
ncbi:hypothetical protein BU15DRAFT_79083 [Melanogaster broomeanus]|nr:hypothetical protein BU15DRAFT_79083 [Melanogaster broomeanus]